jgi:hypothetical protein
VIQVDEPIAASPLSGITEDTIEVFFASLASLAASMRNNIRAAAEGVVSMGCEKRLPLAVAHF